MTALPIDSILPELLSALRAGSNAVLQAPPGAGKTTKVPLALLDEAWTQGGKIIVLEPRRLAARAAASRMAELLGEAVGQTVGYRVRLENKVSAATRIEVVTEGILTRQIQRDPELSGVAAVLFDEFHERSLQADLGLALCLEVQDALRDDLRLLAMSATLEGEAVSRVLGDAPIVTSEGRSFPVELRYGREITRRDIPTAMAEQIREAVTQESGSLLAFLPGVGEIKKVEGLLRDLALPEGVDLRPLYGDMSLNDQQKAIAPSAPGRRKVVLATSIAETSLTIDGVCVVVDCGYMRVPRFDPRSAMTRLETLRVSRASAEQRAGRAGRLEPGICYRLWPEAQNGALPAQGKAEILEADLANLVLELALWGAQQAGDLRWIDPPPAAAFSQAQELLQQLGALDGQGRITAHGREIAALPVHPRLAHMLVKGRELGQGWIACLVAALLSERDILFRADGNSPVDLTIRLEALLKGKSASGHRVDKGRAQRVKKIAAQFARLIKVREGAETPLAAAGALLSLAYPDRIAQQRPGRTGGKGGQYKLSGGKGGEFDPLDRLSGERYLAVADAGGNRATLTIYLAAPLSEEDLRKLHGERIETLEVVEWDDAKGAVLAERQERLGGLVLSRERIAKPSQEAVQQALINEVRRKGLSLLGPSDEVRHLQQRVAFVRSHMGDEHWPDLSDKSLQASVDDWLLPYLSSVRSLEGLRGLDLKMMLLGMLSWEQQQELDRLAPARIKVPSGSAIKINYAKPEAPALEVRIQEVFGLTETPRVGGGRVPLTLHLLSPARRPIQVTQDLAGFWSGSYGEVKKEMKGRYPKHYWPDDPSIAEATTRTKKRMETKS